MNHEAARIAWKRRFRTFDESIKRTFIYDIEDLPDRLIAKELQRICEMIIKDKGFYIVGEYPT